MRFYSPTVSPNIRLSGHVSGQFGRLFGHDVRSSLGLDTPSTPASPLSHKIQIIVLCLKLPHRTTACSVSILRRPDNRPNKRPDSHSATKLLPSPSLGLIVAHLTNYIVPYGPLWLNFYRGKFSGFYKQTSSLAEVMHWSMKWSAYQEGW